MPNGNTILVVDDDPQIVRVLRSYLVANGFHVLFAHDGETALHIMRREHPDVILLDIMLPKRNGWDLTKLIHADPMLRRTLIVHVTAKVEDSQKVVGLEIGADDYITKPFNPSEVIARVRSLLRRSELNQQTADQVLRCGNLSMNMATREVKRGTHSMHLTPIEFKLLHALMQVPDRVFTRAQLIELAHGYDYEGISLGSHIRNLRKKIEVDPQKPQYILTIYGVGYKLSSDPVE